MHIRQSLSNQGTLIYLFYISLSAHIIKLSHNCKGNSYFAKETELSHLH